jgi:lysophospholipase L1-like esterase
MSRFLRVLLEWLGVVLVTLLVAEVALRTVLDVKPLTPGQFLFEYHPTRGWTHRPGAADLYVKLGCRQEIDINSRGLREREIPYEREAGVHRILVVGDSQVVGFEVAQDETFTRVAERALRGAGHRVEIINGGFRGYGTDQVLLFLREEGLEYRPDLVLYHWGLNDPQDNMTLHRPFRKFSKGYFDLDADGQLELRGTPVVKYPHDANVKVGADGEPIELQVPPGTRAMLWVRDLSVTRSALATALANIVLVTPSFVQGMRGVTAYQDFEPELDRKSRIFRVTQSLVAAMEREVRESGAEFRLVSASGPWGQALHDSLSLPTLGVSERFAASIPEGAELIVPFDSHLNALGHELFGEALAESLTEAGLIGRGPASDPGSS